MTSNQYIFIEHLLRCPVGKDKVIGQGPNRSKPQRAPIHTPRGDFSENLVEALDQGYTIKTLCPPNSHLPPPPPEWTKRKVKEGKAETENSGSCQQISGIYAS